MKFSGLTFYHSMVLLIFSQSLTLSGCLETKNATSASQVGAGNSFDPCALNEITNAPCIAVSGALISINFGSNITSWTNETGSSTLSAAIPNASYLNKSVQFTDDKLIAENIRSDVTVFGVRGTYIGSFQLNMLSTQHRNRLQIPNSLYTEATTQAGLPYTNSGSAYRAIPKISADDDGIVGINVIAVDRANWNSQTCGINKTTILARIADCAAHPAIGPSATWVGAQKGNAGHGTWKLVTRIGSPTNGKGREVWRDERFELPIWQ